MSRSVQSRLLRVGVPLAAITALLVTLISLLKSVPAFYRDSQPPDNYDTREKASYLVTRVQDFKHAIRTQRQWGITLTAEELNCFFAEMMGPQGSFVGWLPQGFHSPLVAIDGDRLRLAARYGHGWRSVVVSIELRIWLVAELTNVVAVEVCDLRVGRLPLSTQWLLDAIAEAAHAARVEVTWYRHNDHPVGVFRFFPDQPRIVSQLLTVEVADGAITVAGRTAVEAMPPAPAAENEP